jgi:tetratricopeptide (TPR) repeat protein
MLNLHELEKRWLKYKIKSFLWYLLPIFILFIILLAFLYRDILFSQNSTSKKVDKNNTHPATIMLKTKETKKTDITDEKNVQPNIKKPVTVIEQNSSSVTPVPIKLKPSMNFIDDIKSTPQTQKKEKKIEPKKYTHIPVKNKPSKIEQKKELKEQNPSLNIRIKREETKKDLQDVIQRFQHNKNPALSLFIAKKYYELGDYSQSYNYALITNQLNKDIEQSWIIFAKSLVKLHKKNDAMNTLKKYIDYSHSSNAVILLDNIKTGKFK